MVRMAAIDHTNNPVSNISPHLGRWAWFGIVLVLLGVFYTGVVRNLDPVGDKFFFHMYPGGGDFVYPYNGARALLAGVDPYTHDVPELFDPWGRDEPVNGIIFRQFYPPSHLAAYVPLVLITDGNFRAASRLWFHLNLLGLLTLSLVSCLLVARVFRWSYTFEMYGAMLFPSMLFALCMNQGVAIGLERGQSDIFTATLCWVGVLAWLCEKRFLPLLLVVTAALFKGYAILFALGLCLLGLIEGRRLLPIFAGAILPILILVVPVLEHFPKGVDATIYRADKFWNIWYNHGFKNLIYNVSTEFAAVGNFLLFALTTSVAALVWWRLSRAEPETKPMWMVLFACASLTAMLGVSGLSVSYNLILILPGILVLIATQKKLAVASSLGNEGLLGLLLGLAGLSLVVLRLNSDTFPIASIGLLCIVFVSGLVALTAARAAGSD